MDKSDKNGNQLHFYHVFMNFTSQTLVFVWVVNVHLTPP